MNNRDNQKLPPGQQLVAPGKWPIVGERSPTAQAEPWTVALGGCVHRPAKWTLEELRGMPSTSAVVDIHCVTRWSKFGVKFSGVRLSQLLDDVGVSNDARFVSFTAASDRQHSTS